MIKDIFLMPELPESNRHKYNSNSSKYTHQPLKYVLVITCFRQRNGICGGGFIQNLTIAHFETTNPPEIVASRTVITHVTCLIGRLHGDNKNLTHVAIRDTKANDSGFCADCVVDLCCQVNRFPHISNSVKVILSVFISS